MAEPRSILPEKGRWWLREEIRDDAQARGELYVPKPDGTWEKDYLLVWELPGQGSPGIQCGEEMLIRCVACNRQVWIESSCRDRLCPDCFRLWAWDESYKARTRLAMGARYYNIHYRARHVIVSPPQEPLPGTRRELALLRGKAQAVLRAMGHKGGAMLFHPWRKRCGECGGVLECDLKVCSDHPDAKTSWEEGPHFHVVGYGAVNAEDRKDGWVVRTLARRRSVVGTLFYLLTHVGISRRSHSLTWFGWWGYRALGNEELTRVLYGAGMLPQGESRMLTFQEWQEAERKDAALGRCPNCDGTMEIVPQGDVDLFGWDQVLQIGGDDHG